jgi:hypothetical protein
MYIIYGKKIYIFPIISILTTFYFTFNASEFLSKVGDKCDACAGTIPRYVIGAIDIMHIIKMALIALLTVVLIITKTKYNMRNNSVLLMGFILYGLVGFTYIYGVNPNKFIDNILQATEGFKAKKNGKEGFKCMAHSLNKESSGGCGCGA